MILKYLAEDIRDASADKHANLAPALGFVGSTRQGTLSLQGLE